MRLRIVLSSFLFCSCILGDKHAFSVSSKSVMLRYNSFPGVDMDELGGMNYFLKVPVQILSGTKSATKPSSWLWGLRNEIFGSYCGAQKAIAKYVDN